MGFFIVIIIIILCLFFYIFFVQVSKKDLPAKHKPDGKNKFGKNRTVDHNASFSLHNSSQSLPNDQGIPVAEQYQSVKTDELKKQIQAGIDLVFSEEPASDSGTDKALKADEVDPGVWRNVLNQINSLASFKAVHQINKTLDDPNTSMSKLSKLIVTDPVLSGRILKVANSACFGLQQKVNSIAHALMIIGLLNLKTILYQEGILKSLKIKNIFKENTVESLWEHATLTSVCASYISNLFSGVDKGTLFTMGLLHDVGKILLTGLDPVKQQLDEPSKLALTEFSIQQEEEFFGISHPVIAGMAFQQWGFSDIMIKTVQIHHTPSEGNLSSLCLDNDQLNYLLVLFLSDQAAKIFADKEKNSFPIHRLARNFHKMVDKDRLTNVLLDSSLLSEIRKAKMMMA